MGDRNWVFPMAGKGERTRALGEFKPFITILGKTIAEWFLHSIRNNIHSKDELIFITTEYFEKNYGFTNTIGRILEVSGISNKFHVCCAESTPSGPAASVMQAVDFINSDNPCLVMNSDQFTHIKLPEISRKKAVLTVNVDTGQSKSYVEIRDQLIIRLAEKDNISNIASTGFYGVGSGKDLVTILKRQEREKSKINGEYYVAPALAYLLDMGYIIKPCPVSVRFDLGTIEKIEFFKEFITGLQE